MQPCSMGTGIRDWLYATVLYGTSSRMFSVPPGFPEVDYFQAAAQHVEGTGGTGR